MRDPLRCVLSEARDTRGQELFADKDAVAVVGKRTWSLRRDTHIDRLGRGACRGGCGRVRARQPAPAIHGGPTALVSVTPVRECSPVASRDTPRTEREVRVQGRQDLRWKQRMITGLGAKDRPTPASPPRARPRTRPSTSRAR